MFCPTCGKGEFTQIKFCPACGTNLEVISDALSGSTDSIFVKVNRALDKFAASYAEQVFDQLSAKALDREVSSSWRLLGQAILTLLFNIVLLPLMVAFVPIRFIILLVYTPFYLLAKRSRLKKGIREGQEPNRELAAAISGPYGRSIGPAGSVTEETTAHLATVVSKKRPIKRNITS